jgi:hypothetical protein
MGTYLQPYYHQIPKTNHADFSGSIANPSSPILDCYHVHEVKDELHGEECSYKSDKVQ